MNSKGSQMKQSRTASDIGNPVFTAGGNLIKATFREASLEAASISCLINQPVDVARFGDQWIILNFAELEQRLLPIIRSASTDPWSEGRSVRSFSTYQELRQEVDRARLVLSRSTTGHEDSPGEEDPRRERNEEINDYEDGIERSKEDGWFYGDEQ